MAERGQDAAKDPKRSRPTPENSPGSPLPKQARLSEEDNAGDSHRHERSGCSNDRSDTRPPVASQQDSAITGTAACGSASGTSAGTAATMAAHATGPSNTARGPRIAPRTLLVTGMAGAEGTMFGDGGSRIKDGAVLIGITTAGHLGIVSMSSLTIADLLNQTGGAAPLGSYITFEPARTATVPNTALRPFTDIPLQQYRTDRIIRVEPATDMPLYVGKMAIRAAPTDVDGRPTNEQQGIDGQALLILPTGSAFPNGPFMKMPARLYVKTSHNQTSTATTELAIKQAYTGHLMELLDTAGAALQPLLLFGGKVRSSNTQFAPSIYVGGGAIVRANPMHPLVEQFVAAATAPPVANEVDQWDLRDEEPTVLPQDGVHRNAKLRPLPTTNCSASGVPVLPLILLANDRTYPVCIKEPALAAQLPGWTSDLPNTTNDNRALFLAMAEFTLTADVTTHTIGRTTFVTRLVLV